MFGRYCAWGLLFVVASFGHAHAANEEGAVESTLRAYEDAWSHHDATLAASFYYEPTVRVTAAGPMVRAKRQDQEDFFKNFFPGLVKGGYDHSAWESLSIRLLDPRTAVASGVTVRYRADGSVFARLGVTYLLYSTPDGWKIFFSSTHEPASALRFK